MTETGICMIMEKSIQSIQDYIVMKHMAGGLSEKDV